MSDHQPDSSKGLRSTQRWLYAVITHPDGVEPGVTSAQALGLAPPGSSAAAVITRSRNLTAEQRLAVYQNAYYARLLGCLREEFPTLVVALTEEVFDAFAFGYLQSYPPTSYTLGRLAADFTRYLIESLEADRGGSAGAPGWEEFLIDLATLEWAYAEVFDGPGIERGEAFDIAGLARVPPGQWLDLRFSPAPCLRLLQLRFPAHRYYTAVRRGDGAPVPVAEPTYLAVTRRDYVVEHLELAADEHALLRELVAGRPLGEALAAVAGYDHDRLQPHLRDWFARWAAEPIFIAAGLNEPADAARR